VELKDYLSVLVKRGWIIILVAVITASSAFIFSKVQTVVYRSSIQLNVIPARLDWGLQQTIKNLMRNYSGEIKSRTTAQKVINRQQLDLSIDDILAMMTVSPIESDFLMQIDIDDIDPERAQLIAQTAAEIFVEDKRVAMLEQDKRDRVDVTIRDNAAPARVFWLEWLARDIIRDSRDIERYSGLTVLGSIPATASSRSKSRWPAPQA
jgi:capsular polysaccharide biosynthesis protein